MRLLPCYESCIMCGLGHVPWLPGRSLLKRGKFTCLHYGQYLPNHGAVMMINWQENGLYLYQTCHTVLQRWWTLQNWCTKAEINWIWVCFLSRMNKLQIDSQTSNVKEHPQSYPSTSVQFVERPCFFSMLLSLIAEQGEPMKFWASLKFLITILYESSLSSSMKLVNC